jgi:hypothetical protein
VEKKFVIAILHDRKKIRLTVEIVETTKETEKYKVIARNQSFIVQNNRPLIRGKGLKHFPVKWKVVEGGYYHLGILEQIQKAIIEKMQ